MSILFLRFNLTDWNTCPHKSFTEVQYIKECRVWFYPGFESRFGIAPVEDMLQNA
jgi:hypothetical protein